MAESRAGGGDEWRFQALRDETAAVERRGEKRLAEAEQRWKEALAAVNQFAIQLQAELHQLKDRSARAIEAYDKESEDNRQISTTLRVAMYSTIATGVMTAIVIGILVPYLQGLHK